MRTILLSIVLLVAFVGKASAGWQVFIDIPDIFMDQIDRYEERQYYKRRQREQYRQEKRIERPAPRQSIDTSEPRLQFIEHSFKPKTVLIDSKSHKLYFFYDEESAYVYPIGVGRDGFRWRGVEKISKIVYNPDWIPPPEMRARKPGLPVRIDGGDPRNPLGVVAMYLGNTLYRIHGTDAPQTVGTSNSSGCFRMYNTHALHLARLVREGTVVYVR